MCEEKKQCPNFPYFGATYPDAVCIDGSLHDLDDCPDEGGGQVYLKEEDFPCPFCREKEYRKKLKEDGYPKTKIDAHIKFINEKYNQKP